VNTETGKEMLAAIKRIGFAYAIRNP